MPCSLCECGKVLWFLFSPLGNEEKMRSGTFSRATSNSHYDQPCPQQRPHPPIPVMARAFSARVWHLWTPGLLPMPTGVARLWGDSLHVDAAAIPRPHGNHSQRNQPMVSEVTCPACMLAWRLAWLCVSVMEPEGFPYLVDQNIS